MRSRRALAGKAILPYNEPMTKLTVSSKGQVTLKREVLQHLGVRPGDKIEVEPGPGGRVTIQASRPSGSIDDFIGVLAGTSKKRASLKEIQGAIEAGWSGEK